MIAAAQHPEQLAYYHGAALADALFKAHPDDFVVHEQFIPTFNAAGEHLYVLVEKREQNTQWVAAQLAQAAAIAPTAVGFCA